jgi:hypothetical protein
MEVAGANAHYAFGSAVAVDIPVAAWLNLGRQAARHLFMILCESSFEAEHACPILRQGKPGWSALRVTVLILCLDFFTFVPAEASIYLNANFDDLTEGSEGSSFSDGGISFSDINERIPDFTGGTFDIQATTASLPGFSPPNYLTFDGFAPGPAAYSFGRFGSATIGFAGIGSFASMDIFGFGTSSSNTLTLEGLSGGNVVESDTVTFYSTSQGVVYRPLSISGTFDSLQLTAAGPDNNGTDFFGMDNVNITIVPEPPVGGLVCGALAGVILRHSGFRVRRNQKALP